MKAKDLASPFCWEERRVSFEKGVLYIPDYLEHSENHSLPPFDERRKKVKVEFCSGNGAWLIEQAKKEPDVTWLGVEKRFDRTRKIWAKKENAGLTSLFLVCGDGRLWLEHYVPKGSLDRIHINFPDPWPKKKHAKHRLINADFLEHCFEALVLGGDLLFVSDDFSYIKELMALVEKSEKFSSELEELKGMDGYGRSYFSELWLSKGREIRLLRLQKKEVLCVN